MASTRTFQIRFSSVYKGGRPPKPVVVTVAAKGKSLLDSTNEAIAKVVKQLDINDEAFRTHASLIGEDQDQPSLASSKVEWIQTKDAQGKLLLAVANVSFGFQDDKDRTIGCMLRIKAVENSDEHDSWIQSVRDGASFGAMPPRKRHAASETIDQIKADLLKRAEQSRKRQAKAHNASATGVQSAK